MPCDICVGDADLRPLRGGLLMRLQVFLSHNGVCSRRNAMDKVQEGHVRVNGELVTE